MMDITYEEVKKYFYFDETEQALFNRVDRGSAIAGELSGGIGGGRCGDRWQIWFNYRKYYAYRLVFLYHNKYLPEVVHHKDLDKTNDKLENLQELTVEEHNLLNHNKKGD